MNPTMKMKWVEALRSGRYLQGTDHLRDAQDRYCCLGVYCDISGRGAWRRAAWDHWKYAMDCERSCSGLLDDVMLSEAGISGQQQLNLMNMNDTYRNDFDEIADWIEASL